MLNHKKLLQQHAHQFQDDILFQPGSLVDGKPATDGSEVRLSEQNSQLLNRLHLPATKTYILHTESIGRGRKSLANPARVRDRYLSRAAVEIWKHNLALVSIEIQTLSVSTKLYHLKSKSCGKSERVTTICYWLLSPDHKKVGGVNNRMPQPRTLRLNPLIPAGSENFLLRNDPHCKNSYCESTLLRVHCFKLLYCCHDKHHNNDGHHYDCRQQILGDT